MTRTMSSYLNVFRLTGISLKKIEKKKSFCKNFVAICSHAILLIYLLSLGGTVYLKPSFAARARGRLFLNISFYYFCICVFVKITLTITKKNVEKNFWELVNEAERIFKYQLRVKLNYKIFSIICWLKVFLPTLVLSFILMVALVSAVMQRSDWFDLAFTGPVMFSQFFIMKFIFKVTVLRFWLNEIRVKLSQENLSVAEMKALKKAYTLCWKMCFMINEIFGWGLLLQSYATFFAVLVSGYSLIVGTGVNVEKADIIHSFSVNVFELLLLGGTCQTCIILLTSIASLVFKKISIDFHPCIESFAFQLLHQRIVFAPLKVFEINNKTLTSVSILLPKYYFQLQIQLQAIATLIMYNLIVLQFEVS